MNKKTERTQNLRLVIEMLRRNGAMSQARLKEHCGLQASTISYLVNDLKKEGLVRDSGVVQQEGKVGKPGSLIQLDNDTASVLGLYLEDNWIDAYLIGIDGRTLAYEMVHFENAGIQETMVSLIARSLQRYPQIRGVGIAVKAIVYNDGTIKSDKHRDSMGHEWNISGLTGALEAAFPALPIVMENDANCAAELYCYETRREGGSLIVYLLNQLPFGIGCGLMVHGRVFRGTSGSAGEYFERNSGLRDLVCKETVRLEEVICGIRHHMESAVYLLDPECVVLSGSYFKDLTPKAGAAIEESLKDLPVAVRVSCGEATLNPARGAALLAINAFAKNIVEEVMKR